MLENPFSVLERRLNCLESLLIEIKKSQSNNQPISLQVGGISLAQEITGLSKNTLYAMASKRQIPHSKPEGSNKLFFNRAELLEWVAAGSRKQQKTR